MICVNTRVRKFSEMVPFSGWGSDLSRSEIRVHSKTFRTCMLTYVFTWVTPPGSINSVGSSKFLFYISNCILSIFKQLLVQMLTDHVPLNGWFLVTQTIKGGIYQFMIWWYNTPIALFWTENNAPFWRSITSVCHFWGKHTAPKYCC